MDIEIGTFSAETRSVPVTFTDGEIVHSRDVNAVLNDDGDYDAVATEARVGEVARGVSAKISLGVIKKTEEVAEVADTEPAP